MKGSTYRLHETLIRLLKGCLKAWETWLREQKHVGLQPDSQIPLSSIPLETEAK